MTRGRGCAAVAIAVIAGMASGSAAPPSLGAVSGDSPAAAQTLQPLPSGLAPGGDLRGPFRGAFCGRSALAPAECDRLLRRFAGEAMASRPAAAAPARYRMLFVPGFLATCFPGVHSFGDMIAAARADGFQAEALVVGGRDGVAANARVLAGQVDRLPDDGRRLLFVTHSKGALDALAMLGARPDIAARTEAVLAIAGPLQGSPLADDLRGLYAASFAWWPFPGCARGAGDPIADLSPAASRTFWNGPAGRSGVPVYAIASAADLAGLSPMLLPTYLRLASAVGANDGMVALRDQVTPAVALLGVVNADHLRVAIPFPGPAFVLLFNAEPFPRGAMLLAAIDVIAARSQAPRSASGPGALARLRLAQPAPWAAHEGDGIASGALQPPRRVE